MKKNIVLLLLLAIVNLGLAQQTIFVNPNPIVNAGPDLILLPNMDSIQTQASVDDPLSVIHWDGPNGFTSSVLNPWISSLGIYTLTATNDFGCSSSDQMLLREANPGDNIFSPPQWMCLGEDPLSLFEYTSKIEGTFSGPGVSGNYFYPDSAGVGTHIIAWHPNEEEEISASITILAGPDVRVDRKKLFGCEGGEVTLVAVGQADSYTWSLLDDDEILSNDQYYSVLVDEITSYQLSASKIYTEYDKICYTRDTTTVYPIVASFTYEQETGEIEYGEIYGSKITFTPDFLYGDSYSWNFGDIYVPGGGVSDEKIPTYNYEYYGHYRVNLTMTSVCGVSSTEQIVKVNYLVSAEINNLNKISLYPNPAIDYVYVDFGDTQVDRVYVIDISGREVLMQQVYSNIIQLDVSSFKSAMYLMKFVDKQGRVFTTKFVKK